MAGFLEELEKGCRQPRYERIGTPFMNFVNSGDEAALRAAVKDRRRTLWLNDSLPAVWHTLPEPAALSPAEKRAMQAFAEIEPYQLAGWLAEKLRTTGDDIDSYVVAFVEAFGNTSEGRVRAAVQIVSQEGQTLENRQGQPNAPGRFLLSLSDEELSALGESAGEPAKVLCFLARHVPPRLPAIAGSFLWFNVGKSLILRSDCCRILLEHDCQTFEALIADSARKEKKLNPRAQVLGILADHLPQKYRAEAKKANLALLKKIDSPEIDTEGAMAMLRWLIRPLEPDVLPLLEACFSSARWAWFIETHLDLVAEELGPGAAPLFLAALRHSEDDVRHAALTHLMNLADSQYDAALRDGLIAGLDSDKPATAVKYIVLAGRWRAAALVPELWKLFEHKSKPVRQAAARVLARIPDESVPKACELLSAKKAIVRSAAVTLLSIARTPAAAEALEARLDQEADEEVRDQILVALEQVWEAQGKKISRADIEARVARSADKLEQPPPKWLAESKLPPLFYAGARPEKLPQETVRYLLYRQSRAKEMRADIEAKPLYALIDRKRSGDFALTVLEMFCTGPTDSEDRWSLALAGLLGDDRVVPPIMQQIRTWVEGSRGKMAEYAAQALALLGTDAALCAVDALALRYRNKQKNIGKAAGEAFAAAADTLGISVDELGDRVVPWLGFEGGKPRVVEQGGKKIEARIGLDFKLGFRDLEKGKKIASLPSGIPATVKAELKDLGAALREVLKGQLSRLENLMVRQYRWPVSRWRDLYLVHPVLFPFAARLVWAVYGADGKPQALFRALEDRTLTNERDETVELPAKDDAARIGIVHPLELSLDQRQAWLTHLADYGVEPVFPQMDRPVIFIPADDCGLRFSSKYTGTELNGMTFKGRAERLGWRRGSVSDGGSIPTYCKSFPGAGADAILYLDGMFIGIDMYSNVTLDKFCFVKSGSVTFGSYTYDDPENDKDERLIAFGQVPPIVFSETLGDLAKIAGKQNEDGEAA